VIKDQASLLKSIQDLGHEWHSQGSLSNAALEEFFRIGQVSDLRYTLETGCGRTTLLFSHLSSCHLVFTLASTDAKDSYVRVHTSPLFNAHNTRFVLGPTQKTVPAFQFEQQFDLVLLDGPHSYPFTDLEYYFVYPHVKEGGYLVIDDIHIPTIYNMFCFLKEDEMYHLEKVIDNTAFFKRTSAPLFNPYADGWKGQRYNRTRFPINHSGVPKYRRLRRLLPKTLRKYVKRYLMR
jgi:hypothetical protein